MRSKLTPGAVAVFIGAVAVVRHGRIIPTEIEVHAGSAHDWCPPDSRVYNEAQAERAWSRLLALYEKALV